MNPIFSFIAGKKSKEEDPSHKQQSDQGHLVIPIGRRIGSCLTHRPDIIWIDIKSGKDEILALIHEYPLFSMFPVCSGAVDSVLGVISVRDFLESLLTPQWPGLKPLLRKPVYLPETAGIATALTVLEESRCRMAFIIDEYGGIEGLVTRNGLMSELLSEYSIKSGEDNPEIIQRQDGSWLIGGQVRIDELQEIITIPGIENHEHDFYTLAGYLMTLKGNIPKTGDVLQVESIRFEIVDMDGHRIDKVLVSSTEEVQGSTI